MINGKRWARNRRARFESKALELLVEAKAWLDERHWKVEHEELLDVVMHNVKLAQAIQLLLAERHMGTEE